MKVRWWEKVWVYTAAVVMSDDEFCRFLDRRGLDVNERFQLVRAATNGSESLQKENT